MTSPSADVIPLAKVAGDARGLIEAFRANGEISFQDVPLEAARANYLMACAANGLPIEAVHEVETIEFLVADGTARLRRYRPHGTRDLVLTPVVIFIHGGGWVIGDLDSHDTLCRALANRTAATVIAVDYRLAPEYRFPIQLNDCYAALEYVRDHAQALQVDTSQMVIAGDSAGGNLATVLANHPHSQVQGLEISGQVLFYPVTDLTARQPSYARITSGFPLTARSMHWFRELYAGGEQDWSDSRLSPLLHAADKQQPPLFILTVGHDPLADEGIAYAAAAAQAGTQVEHHHLPEHAHGVMTNAGKISAGRRILEQAAEFINRLFETQA